MKIWSIVEFADWWCDYMPPIYLSNHAPRSVVGRVLAVILFIPWIIAWVFGYGIGGLPFIVLEILRWVRRG